MNEELLEEELGAPSPGRSWQTLRRLWESVCDQRARLAVVLVSQFFVVIFG